MVSEHELVERVAALRQAIAPLEVALANIEAQLPAAEAAAAEARRLEEAARDAHHTAQQAAWAEAEGVWEQARQYLIRLSAQVNSLAEERSWARNRLRQLREQLDALEPRLATAQAQTETRRSRLQAFPDKLERDERGGRRLRFGRARGSGGGRSRYRPELVVRMTRSDPEILSQRATMLHDRVRRSRCHGYRYPE
jgi:chromosome segregation ATPase